MAWQHRITNVDTETMTADCAFCGRVPVYYKKSKNRYICKLARNQWIRGGVKRRLTRVPDVCEICGGNYVISYDHDHKTGEHRGWLCMHCNTALGLVKDDPVILQKMIEYLTR